MRKMFDFLGICICVPLYTIAVFLLGAYMTAGLLAIHVVVVPLIFKYSKTFRRSLIFANFVQWPMFLDLNKPSTCGIEGVRCLSITHDSKVDNCKVTIGAWHIFPKSVYEKHKAKFDLEKIDQESLNALADNELANSKRPIILYCHGNSNSRGASHRIELYKFFQKMDFHTIAFDYRGYGDSTNIHPSEPGVVEDALNIYSWLLLTVENLSRDEKPPVFVWGHSLGTGISSHMLGNLENLPQPNGLILEAPFNNLADEVAHHPLAKLVSWLPYFEHTFVSEFKSRPEHTFRSDEHLARTPSLPVLILHAKDDVIVPYVVGVKLFKSVQQSRNSSDAPVVLHSYEKDEGLGHKWICNAKDLDQVIGNFVEAHGTKKSQ